MSFEERPLTYCQDIHRTLGGIVYPQLSPTIHQYFLLISLKRITSSLFILATRAVNLPYTQLSLVQKQDSVIGLPRFDLISQLNPNLAYSPTGGVYCRSGKKRNFKCDYDSTYLRNLFYRRYIHHCISSSY